MNQTNWLGGAVTGDLYGRCGRLCRGPAIACPVWTLDPLPAFLISLTGNIRNTRVGIVWMKENMCLTGDLFFWYIAPDNVAKNFQMVRMQSSPQTSSSLSPTCL